jgi:hypothetical protein
VSGDGIDWATIRPALRGWIVRGAAPDIAASHIIWGGQQRATPDGAYITIDVIDEVDYGYDRVEMVSTINSTTEHVIGDRIVRIRITVFSAITERDATKSWKIASRIRAAAYLSANDEAMTAALCAVVSWSRVTAPGRGIDSSAFEPRAMFDADISVVSDIAITGADAASVIETVNKSGTIQ